MPFKVCITIKTITTFSIWNSFLLLLRIIFYDFLFVYNNVSVPNIFLFTYYCECIHLGFHSLIIHLLLSDTITWLYQHALIWRHQTKKIPSSDICQFHFYNISVLTSFKRTCKGPKRIFSLIRHTILLSGQKTYNNLYHFLSTLVSAHQSSSFSFLQAYLTFPSFHVI